MPDQSPDKQELIDRIAQAQPRFAATLGMRLVSAAPDKVVLVMDAAEPLTNRNGILHGGALMALADNVGGTLAFINLKPGDGTTTLESKTNFMRSVEIGDVATATAIPLHLGRRTIVVQTTITRGDGKVAAIVTQTQMVLPDAG